MIKLIVSLGPIAPDPSQNILASVPVEVLDFDGTLLRHVGVPATQGHEIHLPDGIEGPVFVRARLPSGEQQTKRVELRERGPIAVQLFERDVSPKKWLAWSRPHIRVEQLPRLPVSLQTAFGNVWTRLWRRNQGKWVAVDNVPLEIERERYAGQLDLLLDQASYLLQIGGDHLPWRFVALPGGGRVRVLLTQNNSSDPRADPLRIVVSRMKPDEETLLAYLSHDRIEEAEALSEAPWIAEKLFYGKYEDPVSACIGAYFLLRADRLGERLKWAENLYRDMIWLADGAIILANQLLRSANPPIERIDCLLDEALRRGVPIYFEGMQLLNDACQIMASQYFRKHHAEVRRKRVERFIVAQAWSGATCGFYGRRPDEPRPEKFVGLPNSRKRIDPYAKQIRQVEYRDASSRTSYRSGQFELTSDDRARDNHRALPAPSLSVELVKRSVHAPLKAPIKAHAKVAVREPAKAPVKVKQLSVVKQPKRPPKARVLKDSSLFFLFRE